MPIKLFNVHAFTVINSQDLEQTVILIKDTRIHYYFSYNNIAYMYKTSKK